MSFLLLGVNLRIDQQHKYNDYIPRLCGCSAKLQSTIICYIVEIRLSMKRTCLKHYILGLACLLVMAACVTSPAANFDRYALVAGLSKSTVQTNSFSLATYSKFSLSELAAAPALHIYLGGDGTPWITPNHKSQDPTPRKNTALDLMLLDPNPSIYIGRPCYHGLANQPNCDTKWWTSHRYSTEVIEAMTQAIESISSPSRRLTILGFSGGGSLAMLITHRLSVLNDSSRILSLVTISANLDTSHWARSHNYSILYGSLNPIQQAALDNGIEQTHLLGEKDQNVNALHLHKKLIGRPSTSVQLFPDFDHHCCWQKIWPEFLDNLNGKAQPLK